MRRKARTAVSNPSTDRRPLCRRETSTDSTNPFAKTHSRCTGQALEDRMPRHLPGFTEVRQAWADWLNVGGQAESTLLRAAEKFPAAAFYFLKATAEQRRQLEKGVPFEEVYGET